MSKNKCGYKPTFISFFAGVGGFDLGLERAGWECKGQVEWDKRATQILRRHWADTPRWKDICDVDAKELPQADLFCGGFPCQDLSVAGERRGFDGERSSLWHEFVRLVSVARPRWLLVENVPGLLSSRGGRDLGIILDTLEKCGYGWCWRVLDSQFFGVPQRRRRFFLVGHLGGMPPLEVLFEPESVSWNPPKSRKKRKGTSTNAKESVGGDCGKDQPIDIVHTNKGEVDKSPCLHAGGSRDWNDSERGFQIVHKPLATGMNVGEDKPETIEQRGRDTNLDQALPLNARDHKGVQVVSYNIQTNDGGKHARKDRPNGGMYVSETDKSLTVGSPDQTKVVQSKVVNTNDSNSAGTRIQMGADKSVTLSAHGGGMGAKTGLYALQNTTAGQGGVLIVRRLTPLECERLQGFPDGHTEIGIDEDGNEVILPDTPRYQQMGNAVTVNVIEWIGRRLAPFIKEDL